MTKRIGILVMAVGMSLGLVSGVVATPLPTVPRPEATIR
jgi:hypothetical protein